jgi:hypothetical protein
MAPTRADRVFASDSIVRRRRGFRHYFSVLGDFKGLRGENFRLGRRRGLWLVARFRRLGRAVVGTKEAMNKR